MDKLGAVVPYVEVTTVYVEGDVAWEPYRAWGNFILLRSLSFHLEAAECHHESDCKNGFHKCVFSV